MNQRMEITSESEVTKVVPALLHEMIRSFTTLARTLNLSHAVKELGSTRQTVRRHITQLEASIGEELFVVDDRRYQLTDAGQRALAPAQSILAQGSVWLNGQFDHVDGMMRLAFQGEGDWLFFQQQQPISRVWESNSDLLKSAIKAWAVTEGNLEHPLMSGVRPYILVYRESPGGWICAEVGEKSFYSNWYGWANAKSSVGRTLDQFPGGAEFANLMNQPFAKVHINRGLRLDQVLTRMPRSPGAPVDYLAFSRLLLGVQLPDGSPALMVVVDRAESMLIADVDPDLLEQMPADACVHFDPEDSF